MLEGLDDEASCLICGYVEYTARGASRNGRSGPAIAGVLPGEKLHESGGRVEDWLHEGERILATLEEEKARRRKELAALEFRIRSIRWRVGGGFAHYWSPEKRAEQAERMRAMNYARKAKEVSAAIAT